MNARLRLNRLTVHRGGNRLYDESFHDGVNIIHGDNGSGKSTIADFIYFVLGGDLKDWRKEAALADFVAAEVTTGEATLTLKRDVTEEPSRPMSIFFGTYTQAMKAGPDQWETFSYKRQEGTLSFSQVLFKAIGIPEAISDGASNITMNQLLRILYSDQLTPIQRIFRVEPFDTWQTRKAVGDLLCGLGGYDLYNYQLFLRQLEKEFDEAASRFKGLMAVAGGFGDGILIEHIGAALNNAILQREELQSQLTALVEGDAVAKGATAETQQAVKLRKELSNAKQSVAKLLDEIEVLDYEVRDVHRFMEYLRSALAEFDDASSTFFALGRVRFEFCPSCFAALGDEHAPEGENCHLCGNVLQPGEDQSRALAVKLDLQMQIDESRTLQAARSERLAELQDKLRIAKSEMRKAEANYDFARRSSTSSIENALTGVSRQIGYLDHQIQQLNRRETLSNEIARVSKEKAELNVRITEMKDRIQATERAQRSRQSLAYGEIAGATKDMLDKDMAEHSDFGVVEKVTFSFADDWIAINDDKNRVGSASGMVVLKNSFLLSLFSASLIDGLFNLPRFMLMDNIEDKGMVQERSWNFQRLIVQVCESAAMPCQIIFSTSKIAPELDGGPMVVGRKYTKAQRTLRFKQ